MLGLLRRPQRAVAVVAALWAIFFDCGTTTVVAATQHGGGASVEDEPAQYSGDAVVEDEPSPRSHAAILSLLESRLVDDGGSPSGLDSDLRIVG